MGVVIKVMDSRINNVARDKRVGLHGSMGTRSEITNSSGEADFPTAKPGTYTVYVEGREVYKGPISGVRVVTI